jgi:hypothetical protein
MMMLKVPFLWWQLTDDAKVGTLRDKYAVLRAAEDATPGRLSVDAATVLESHQHVAQQLGFDDPADIYDQTDPYSRAGLAILRTYVPTWFQ